MKFPKIMVTTKFTHFDHASSDHSSSQSHHDSFYLLNLTPKPVFEDVGANAPVGLNAIRAKISGSYGHIGLAL